MITARTASTNVRGSVAVVAVVLLLGVAPAAGCDPGVDCTLIGCDDGVSAEIAPEVLAGAVGTVSVRTCADETCSDVSFDAGEARFGLMTTAGLGGRTAGDEVTVTVKVSDDESVLAEHREAVILQTSRPNGPRCDPTCTGAAVTVDDPG